VVDGDGRLVGIVSEGDLLLKEEFADDMADGLVTLDGQVGRASLVPVLTGLVRGVDGVVGVEDHLTYEVDDVARQPSMLTPWGVYEPSLRSRS
jgi:hypothetical protein